MDDLLPEFIAESVENISILDLDVVALEKNPGDNEVLQRIFRAIHSLKGTSGMLGFSRLEHVSHAGEDVLGKMREKTLPINARTIGAVLMAVDAVKVLVMDLQKNGKESPGDDSALIARVRSVLEDVIPIEGTEAGPGVAPQAVSAPALGGSDAFATIGGQSIRVNLETLDRLMDFVGELVLTRNQLIQLVQGQDDSIFSVPIQQMNRVTSGLQEVVMKTRMQPIGSSWSKLPRILRDLSQTMGKEVEIVMSGQDTEIDRQILQTIQDPIVHCIRNSVDHGIERPQVRLAAGKSRMGSIHLSAAQEGGHIVIEIRDDGAGINIEAVKKKAIERGLITADQAEESSKSAILNLIFEAGFSTAEKVTEVSGRGVGMDVVKSNIEKIAGSVELESETGKGSIIRFKIPLTLAIIPALIVSVDGFSFAMPQASVTELVRIGENNIYLVEQIHGFRALRLREELLPLANLSHVLGMAPTTGVMASLGSPKDPPIDLMDKIIIVTRVSGTAFGIVVDEVFDTQEIVVKPVGQLIRGINLFAGTTILGDGKVVLILDAANIAARVLPRAVTKAVEQELLSMGSPGGRGEHAVLLLFKSTSGTPMAVPLSLVSRLEKFQLDQIERVNGQWFIQYRKVLLPVIPCKDFKIDLDAPREPAATVAAIIFSDGRRSMGLLVSEILDVVDEILEIESTGKSGGVLGAAVVNGAATEIIDIHYFLEQAYPGWFRDRHTPSKTSKKMLLLEDNRFFQDLLKPILESWGYDVTLVNNGVEGLEAIAAGTKFDVILSDIEMPEMDGLTFAVHARKNPELKNTPMFALTSLSAPADRERGLKAGFTDYLMKLNKDSLFRVLERIHGSAIASASGQQQLGAGL